MTADTLLDMDSMVYQTSAPATPRGGAKKGPLSVHLSSDRSNYAERKGHSYSERGFEKFDFESRELSPTSPLVDFWPFNGYSPSAPQEDVMFDDQGFDPDYALYSEAISADSLLLVTNDLMNAVNAALSLFPGYQEPAEVDLAQSLYGVQWSGRSSSWRHCSATKIQAAFRGFRVRKNLRKSATLWQQHH